MAKVAFVVQRCGLEVNGGAETHCLKIAKRMAKHWQTEILTTCALDYMSWKNHYSPGITEVSGVQVRRFPVDHQRQLELFNSLSHQIHPRIKELPIEVQETWMYAQGPYCSQLISYISQHKNEYDIFVFFTYLYATTYFALPLVQDKAFLAPLAHDEWPIYMSMWDAFFQKPRGFIFNSVEEKKFLQSRFPNLDLRGPVAGVAVDPPSSYSATDFCSQYSIHERFILYIGRLDPSKGCDELFRDFINLRMHESSPRKLVLLGKPTMPVPKHSDILSLGFVSEETKWNALAACDLLIMPSPYESLSMVLLEAWIMGKPVLVNGKCDVLVGQCRRSQGGLWYTNTEEFQVSIKTITTWIGPCLGLQGKRFVEANYIWAKIEGDYLDLLQMLPNKCNRSQVNPCQPGLGTSKLLWSTS